MCPQMQYAWGEGLVDLSLTTLWRTARWDDVGEDELAFLLPALSSWQPLGTHETNPGPTGYLTRILRERAMSAAALMAERSPPDWQLTAEGALRRLAASGMLTQVPIHAFGSTVNSREVEEFDGDNSLPVWMIAELTAIAYLDRMLSDALGAKIKPEIGRAPIVDWRLSLADVVVCTIHSRLNAAYIYPEYAFAHELLTSAAVLGHLLNGRPAHMPTHVAMCFVEALSTQSASEEYYPLSVLRTYAELACGSAYLLALVKRVCSSGRPYLARPGDVSSVQDIGQLTWNTCLLRRISSEPLWATRRAA